MRGGLKGGSLLIGGAAFLYAQFTGGERRSFGFFGFVAFRIALFAHPAHFEKPGMLER